MTLRALLAATALATTLMTMLIPGAARAQSPAPAQSRYQYVLPPGWSPSIDGDTELLVPGGEPAGAVQVLLLAPKPLAADFDSQFAAERAQLEQFWGLRAPAPAAPQRGQSAQGPYAACFASYDSDGGARYMSFLAQGSGGQFAMLVFVAASHDVFNRVAPQATQLFTTLRIAR
ncbi:MAG: hypothetical protein ACK5JG_08295 [Pseudomonadota bacterium]|jgi:hypothetical protein|nr:hypothetical protein [Rubrivivax sp.]